MPLPGVTLAVTDGGIGTIVPDNSANVLIVGVSSSGTAGVVNTFRSASAIDAVRTAFGEGPIVEAAALYLATGSGDVNVVKATTVTAATSSTMTVTGTSPTITLSGPPNDDYDYLVLVTTGGATSAAYYQFSLDGGQTYNGTPLAMTAPYLMPNTGVTLTFPAGTYVAGDTEAGIAYAGNASDANIATAIQAGLDSTASFSLVHVVGFSAGASDAARATACASLAAAVDAKIATAATSGRYLRAVVDGARVARTGAGATALVSPMATVFSTTVGYGGGEVRILSPIKNRRYYRSVAWAAVARSLRVPISEHAGFVGRGSLGSRFTAPTHDQRVSVTYDNGRAITVCTYPQRGADLFVTRAALLSQPTSDFKRLELGRVMDRACDVALAALTNFVAGSYRVNQTTGKLDAKDAKAIEDTVTGKLKIALKESQHVTDVYFIVDTNNNVLSTGQLKGKVRVLPLAYSEYVSVEVAYFNPAIAS